MFTTIAMATTKMAVMLTLMALFFVRRIFRSTIINTITCRAQADAFATNVAPEVVVRFNITWIFNIVNMQIYNLFWIN